MTHLSRDELRRWWAGETPDDRERIEAHLAVCDACVVLYGDVIDARALDTAPTAVSPRVTAAGHAAFRGQAERPDTPGRITRVRWFVPLSAAAALVIAAILYPLYRSPAEPAPLVPPADEAVRSTTIQTLSPAGSVTAPFRFAWSSPIDSPSYDVTIYDRAGQVISSFRTETSSVDAAPTVLQQLQSGEEYSWAVTALDARGQRTIESQRQRFVVAPGVP
jgi:hypothetical protein